jgi:hypothetical protein
MYTGFKQLAITGLVLITDEHTQHQRSFSNTAIITNEHKKASKDLAKIYKQEIRNHDFFFFWCWAVLRDKLDEASLVDR